MFSRTHVETAVAPCPGISTRGRRGRWNHATTNLHSNSISSRCQRKDSYLACRQNPCQKKRWRRRTACFQRTIQSAGSKLCFLLLSSHYMARLILFFFYLNIDSQSDNLFTIEPRCKICSYRSYVRNWIRIHTIFYGYATFLAIVTFAALLSSSRTIS